MKKIKLLSFILVLSMLLLLISCNKIDDHNAETINGTDEEVNNDNVSLLEQETSDEETTAEIQVDPIPWNDIEFDSHSSGNSACQIVYNFYTFKDIETFMIKGSTDENDYIKRPRPFIDKDDCSYIRQRFVPIEKIFNLDTEAEDVLDSFIYHDRDGGGTVFSYTIYDNLTRIRLEYVSTKTSNKVVDYSSGNVEVLGTFPKKDQHINGGNEYMLSRDINGGTAYYKIYKGNMHYVEFSLGDYVIRIFCNPMATHSDATHEEKQQSYNEFMTSEKTAAFAKFFSEDDEVFEAACDELERNLALALREKAANK